MCIRDRDEAVQVGSTAAKVGEGAAKAGKITAAAANGAALGGPYGCLLYTSRCV